MQSVTSAAMYNCKHAFLCFIFIFIVKAVNTVIELDNGFGKTETSLATKKYMNFGDIIFELPQEQKVLIRRIEQTRKKLTKTKYSLAFNKTCLKEDILPRYTDIKTHDPAARDQHFTKDYRRKLIEFQVSTQ